MGIAGVILKKEDIFMKKIIIAMSLLLLLCGCEKGAEMPSESSETTQSVTTTTAAEVTTTSETTFTTVETTIITTEETTSAKPRLPEPILPPEAVKIDVGSLYEDEKYYFSYTILDNENILVLNEFNNGGNISAKAGIFSLSDGTEKVTFDIPRTEANTFFIKDKTYNFDDENVLCKIYGCKSGEYVNDYTCLSETIVYTDCKYESSEFKYKFYDKYVYKLPGGRSITEMEYGNIIETDSGDLLLNAVFYGYGHKGNIIYSYEFPIDENRFVYSMYGYEWCWGIGVYDFKTGAARDIPDTYNFSPLGVHGGKIYSICVGDGYAENVIYATDVNTLETTRLFEIAENDYADSYGMTPDGEFLFKAVEKENENTSEFILYSADTMEVVRKYEFKNVYLQNWSIYFTKDGKVILTDRVLDYLYILDLNQ